MLKHTFDSFLYLNLLSIFNLVPFLILLSYLVEFFCSYICDLLHEWVSLIHVIFFVMEFWLYFGFYFTNRCLCFRFSLFWMFFACLFISVATFRILIGWFFFLTTVGIAFILRILWMLRVIIQWVLIHIWLPWFYLQFNFLFVSFCFFWASISIFIPNNSPAIYLSCFCLSETSPS